MNQLASIIIPCHNGEDFLSEAVLSCFDQNYPLIEIIIVDDASPDRCVLTARELALKDQRIQIIRHSENQGVAAAFNTGFNAAHGKYFTRLAQDDRFLPDAIQTMATALDQNPDVDMVYADMEYINEHGEVTGQFRTKSPDEALRGCNGIGLCWMFRREVWEREPKGFNSEFDQIEDFEFWMRAKKHSRIMRLDTRPLLQFRQHASSGTAQFAAKMEVLTANVLAKTAQTPKESRKIMAEGAFKASWIYREKNNWTEARHEAWRAVRLNPFSYKYYRNIAGVTCHRKTHSNPQY